MEVLKMSEGIKHNWPELIKEQKTSGKTVDAFCKEKGIHYTSFYKSRKRFQSNSFVEVKVNKKERESDHPITLKYGKYTVILHRGFCKQTFNEILSVMDER